MAGPIPFRQRLLGWLPVRLLGRIRARRVQRLVDDFAPYTTRHDYGGRPLQVWIGDPLARGWYDHDWAPLPEIEALRATRLGPGGCVFDLGAHQGIVALMLAAEVGRSGRVVAVEPHPVNARAARRNRDLNDCPQVHVVEAAVAEHDGSIMLAPGLNAALEDGTGAYGRLAVKATTLDGLMARFGPPDAVFVDVEGAECRVLRAGARALASRAAFAVEVHVGCGLEAQGGSVAELLACFPDDRFDVRVRAEGDAGYRALVDRQTDPLLTDRFFLLAQARAVRS